MPYSIAKDYGADIDWNVGSLFCHESVLEGILDICRFYEIGCGIKYAFGSVSSIMAGGRIPPMELDANEAIKIMDWHLQNGIACRLTLSNPHLTEKDIKEDSINAELMEWLDRHRLPDARNGIILSSDVLAEWIRSKYPNLDVVLSILRPAYETGYGKDKDTLEWYSERLESDLYDIVVVNGAKLYEDGFMEALPLKDKVELIACHDCVRNCPRAKAHYEGMLACSLALHKGDQASASSAQARCASILEDCRLWKRRHPMETAAYAEDEIRKLAAMGYRHFKLAGRTASDEKFKSNLCHYVYRHELMHYLESAF